MHILELTLTYNTLNPKMPNIWERGHIGKLFTLEIGGYLWIGGWGKKGLMFGNFRKERSWSGPRLDFQLFWESDCWFSKECVLTKQLEIEPRSRPGTLEHKLWSGNAIVIKNISKSIMYFFSLCSQYRPTGLTLRDYTKLLFKLLKYKSNFVNLTYALDQL